MKSGLLWFDSSAKPINEKIQDAARRFEQKFGVRPNRAYINARDIPGGNAVNRAREDLQGAMEYMQRKWGHYVRAGKSGDLVLNVGAIKRRQAKV